MENKIKDIRNRWNEFWKNPSEDKAVSTEDLKLWVEHLRETEKRLSAYPECYSTWYFLIQEMHSIQSMIRSRES